MILYFYKFSENDQDNIFFGFGIKQPKIKFFNNLIGKYQEIMDIDIFKKIIKVFTIKNIN